MTDPLSPNSAVPLGQSGAPSKSGILTVNKVPKAADEASATPIVRRQRRGTISIGQVACHDFVKSTSPDPAAGSTAGMIPEFVESTLKPSDSLTSLDGFIEEPQVEFPAKISLESVRVKLLDGDSVVAEKSWKSSDCSELRVRTGDHLEVSDLDAAGWAFVTLVHRFHRTRSKPKMAVVAPKITVVDADVSSVAKKASEHTHKHHARSHSVMDDKRGDHERSHASKRSPSRHQHGEHHHRSVGMRGWVDLNIVCPSAVEKLQSMKPELKEGTVLLAENKALENCFAAPNRTEEVASSIDESSVVSSKSQTRTDLNSFLPKRSTTTELLKRGILMSDFGLMGAYESSKKLWQKNTSVQLAVIMKQSPAMKSRVLASPLTKSASSSHLKPPLRVTKHRSTLSTDHMDLPLSVEARIESASDDDISEPNSPTSSSSSSSVVVVKPEEEKPKKKKKKKKKEVKAEEGEQITKEQLERVVTLFNESAKKGIEEMKQIGLINDETKPSEIAALFHRTDMLPGLNASVVADYLGKDVNNNVLREYIKQVQFKHFSFESALRFFLSWFVLPSEAQAIGRASEAFAQHFFDSCADPDVFADADSVGILSSALLILNPDLHNSSVKTKMTMKQFIPWLRGTNGGHDFAKPLLEELYGHVADCEVKTTNASCQNVIRHGWLNQRLSSIRSIRRWYVLEGTILTSSLKPTEPTRHTFDMREATLVVSNPRKFSFHLMIKEGDLSQELRLRAENEYSFLAWIDALRFVISQIAWVSASSPLSSQIIDAPWATLGQLNQDKGDPESLHASSLRLPHVGATSMNKKKEVDIVHFSTSISQETTLHCYTFIDTMDCLRSAVSVTSVVLLGDSLLVVPSGTAFDSSEKKSQGKTVTLKLNPTQFTEDEVVRSIPTPFAASSSPQGSLFYIASDGYRNVAMAFRWDTESALPVARRLEWIPVSQTLDPETWGHLWDGVPPFIGKALRFWLSLPENQVRESTNPVQTSYARKMTM